MHLWTWVFEPGFFTNQPVRIAALTGGVVAVVSALTGVFTVMRGQSFGGHALSDVSAAGGSGALLLGLSPLVGFVGLGIVGAGVMDMIGVQRVRGRDLATGIVLGAAIGLSALFLQLTTYETATTGAVVQILFGSVFTLPSGSLWVVVACAAVAVASIAVAWRPLLLATVSPDIAAARGVRVRLVGLAFMLALAVSVGLSSLAVGAILSTALLIGPAATALRLTSRMGWAVVVACLTGVGAVLLGLVLAYDSYYWGAGHRSLPVSFFIVVLVFLAYLAAGLVPSRAPRPVSAPAAEAVEGEVCSPASC
ncbi:MAG TPA: metal ABC transporter permease [Streptosporangiaceae bacterium]|nr:metal ABC transporter permease [Streptosporangiaceae bacterium]